MSSDYNKSEAAAHDDEEIRMYIASSQSVESMENILLGSAPELPRVDTLEDLNTTFNSLFMTASATSVNSLQASSAQSGCHPAQSGSDQASSAQSDRQPDGAKQSSLAKYFGSGDSPVDDVFDAIRQVVDPDLSCDPVHFITTDEEGINSRYFSDTNQDERHLQEVAAAVEAQKVAAKSRGRERLTSHGQDIPVSFEEEKGEGLVPAQSTKNLFKYLSDSQMPSSSIDGKPLEDRSFFDSFTVSDSSQCTPVVGDYVEANLDEASSPPPETPPAPVSPPTSANSLTPALEQCEDPFYQSLQTSDCDRRHDAWIPSPSTRTTLDRVGQGTNPVQMMDPTMVSQLQLYCTAQVDPLYELLLRYTGNTAIRKTVSTETVPRNDEGLRELIRQECYRSALDLTGILIEQYRQTEVHGRHCPYYIQLWFVRLALMMKLRMYSVADHEFSPLGSLDQADLYFEFYPSMYPGRKGSMVPFHMRLLISELPLYLNKGQEALDKLHYNLAIVNQIISNLHGGLMEDGSPLCISGESAKLSLCLWESRKLKVLYSLVNCFFSLKDYRATLEVFNQLLYLDQSNECELLSAIGRIYLQIGDVGQAEEYLNRAETALTRTKPTKYNQSKVLANKGFLALAKGQCRDAYHMFEMAVTVDPSNATAANNMAVSALYDCKLQTALQVLEGLVTSQPSLYLQEGLLFNLCTLYELESSHALGKKVKLLELAAKYKGDGFHVACLKLVG